MGPRDHPSRPERHAIATMGGARGWYGPAHQSSHNQPRALDLVAAWRARMNELTPPPPPPPPPPPTDAASSRPAGGVLRPSRHFRAIAITAAAVVVAVAAAGGILALRAFSGSGDSLVSMVPSDTAVYVNVNFDPPASQKLAVQGLLNKFPALNDQSRSATINGWLDTAFSSSGLNHNDISPWLGSELSIAIPASAVSSFTPSAGVSSSSSPGVTVLIASKDDAKAQAALDKFRTGPVGRTNQWTTSAHDGVTVTSAAGNGTGGAYALANHTVIFTSNSEGADAVIDTAHGKRANLLSSDTFTTVESQLPTDRLALVYMDLPALVRQFAASVGSAAGGQGQLSAAQAYGGLGVALVARSDGIEFDGTENYNASKLTADQRAQLGIAPHTNGSLAFVPRSALGFFALTGLQQTLKSVLTTVAPAGSSIDSTLQQFGVTGSGGIITHLSGDAGVEVDQAPGQTLPTGALLFDTDSTTAAQAFLDNLMSSVCRQSSVCDPSQVTRQVDNGVTISSVAVSAAGGSGVQPSWAVSNGWAIIGSSAAEVRAVLDSNASGSTIRTSPSYQAVTSHVGTSNNGVLYVDVPAVLRAVRAALPPSAQASYDSSAAPYLDHFGAVELATRNASDHMTFTLFMQIR